MSLFCWTQRKIFWRMWLTEQFWGTIDFHSIFVPTMEVNGAPKQPGYKLSSKYLPLCSAEQRHSYRFGTTWGWVYDDRIFIFGWTIPLIDAFDLKQRWAECSPYDIKVPRERFECIGSDCFLIALAVLWCHTVIILRSAASSRTCLL